MDYTIGLIVFIYGLVLGSFYNVVADRWLRDESIKGRSKCDNCQTTLTAKNLVPILSFVIQKGKCSNCGIKLGISYMVAEIVTGLGFLVVYLVHGLTIDTVIGLIFMSYLIISGITDAKEGYVLDRVVVLPTLLVLILTIIFKENSLYFNIIPSVIIFLLMLLAVKLEKLGGGDVLIITSVFIVHGSLLASVNMLITATVTLIYMLSTRKKMVPFIPFWVVGNILTYMIVLTGVLN